MHVCYENKEHVRGAVEVAVPSGFTDLSTLHKPLGVLCSEVSAWILMNRVLLEGRNAKWRTVLVKISAFSTCIILWSCV